MKNSKTRVLHKPNKTFFKSNVSSLVNTASKYKKQIVSLRKNNRELAKQLSDMQNCFKTSEDTVASLQRLLNLQVPKVISGNLKKMVGQITSMLDVLNQTLCYCSNPETIGMDSTIISLDLEKTKTPQTQGKMHCLYDGSKNTRTRPVGLQQANDHSGLFPLTPIPEQSLCETSESFGEANGEPQITSKRSSNLSDKNSVRPSKSSELFDANVTRRTKSKGSSSSVIDHISVTPTEPLPTTPCFVDLERLPLPLLNMAEDTQDVLAKEDSLAEKHGPTQSCVDLENSDDFTVKVPIDMELTMIKDTSTFNVDVPKEGNKKPKNLRVMKLILDPKSALHSPHYQANGEIRNTNRGITEEAIENIADRVLAKNIDPFAKSTKTKRTLIPPVKSPFMVETCKTNENAVSKQISPTRLEKSPQVPHGGGAGTTSTALSPSKNLITTVPVDYSEPSVSGIKRKGRLTYTVGVTNSDDTSTSDIDSDSDYTEPATSSKQKVPKVKRGFENYRFFSNAKKKSSQRTVKKSVKQVTKDTTDIAKKSSPSIYDPTFKETPPDKVRRIAGKQRDLSQRKSRADKTPVPNPSTTELNDQCSLHSSSSDSSDSDGILEIKNVQENNVGSVTRPSPRKTFQSILDSDGSSDNNSKDGDSNSDETNLESENITVKEKEKEEDKETEKEEEEQETSSIKKSDVSSASNESETSESDVSWRFKKTKQKKKLPASSRRKPGKGSGNVTNGVHSKSKTALRKNSRSGNQKQSPGNNSDQKRASARGKKSGDTFTEPLERVSLPKTNLVLKKPVTSDAGVSSVKLKKTTTTTRKSRVSSKAIVDVSEGDITTDNDSVKAIDNGLKALVSEPTSNSLSNRKKSVKAVGRSTNSKPELAKRMKLLEDLGKGENDFNHNSESNSSSSFEEAKNSRSSNQNSPAMDTSSKKDKKNLKGPSKLEEGSLSNKKEQQSDKSPHSRSPRKLSFEDNALTKRRRVNPVSYKEVSLNKKLRRQL